MKSAAMVQNFKAPPPGYRYEPPGALSLSSHRRLDAIAPNFQAPPLGCRYEPPGALSLPSHRRLDAIAPKVKAPPPGCRYGPPAWVFPLTGTGSGLTNLDDILWARIFYWVQHPDHQRVVRTWHWQTSTTPRTDMRMVCLRWRRLIDTCRLTLPENM